MVPLALLWLGPEGFEVVRTPVRAAPRVTSVVDAGAVTEVKTDRGDAGRRPGVLRS
jgi:hypothetical protein